MKKICILVILITIVANIYIVFKWDPYKYEEYIPVNSYNINHNNDYKEVGEGYVSKIYDIKDETYYFNDYDTILTLNYDDISKIEEILNKSLSTSDLGKWIELKNDESKESVLDFFKMIKKRLTKAQYEDIKKIIGKNVDVDRIESIIENNYD